MSLASLAERETTLVPISKTQQVEILCGQCMVDNTQLAKLWDKDRKTVPKFYRLWRLWAFPLHKRLETTASLPASSGGKDGGQKVGKVHGIKD